MITDAIAWIVDKLFNAIDWVIGELFYVFMWTVCAVEVAYNMVTRKFDK